jgi:zinc protease
MSKRTSIRLLLIALLTIGSLVSSSAQNAARQGGAQPRAAASATVPRVTVETFTLDNGLQVIVSRRPGLPVVAVNTWYHVGPANEAVGRTGFAHLF